jgi:NADPH:quinone reductase-like Zn-dependent oxidoreductase
MRLGHTIEAIIVLHFRRKGVYNVPTPFVLGMEPAGTVVAVGPGVDPSEYGYKIGDKVVVRVLTVLPMHVGGFTACL